MFGIGKYFKSKKKMGIECGKFIKLKEYIGMRIN